MTDYSSRNLYPISRHVFDFVFENMSGYDRRYYYNKYQYSKHHSDKGCVYDTGQIYLFIKDNKESVKTLIEINEKQGRHVDFSEKWIRCDDSMNTQIETSNDDKELMKDHLDGMYDWINTYDHLVIEWIELYVQLSPREERNAATQNQGEIHADY